MAVKKKVFISEFRIAVGQAINIVAQTHPDMGVDLTSEDMKYSKEFVDTVERTAHRLLKIQGNMLVRSKKWDDVEIQFPKKS